MESKWKHGILELTPEMLLQNGEAICWGKIATKDSRWGKNSSNRYAMATETD